MEADKNLCAALKPLGFPVSRLFHRVAEKKPVPPTYLTYQLIHGAGELYADDDNEATQSTWRVDLYSKSDYGDTIPKVIRALKDAEFYGVTVEAEQYEQDTGYYHISFEAKFLTMEV